MSMARVKRAYIKPTWTEVRGPWSFFIGPFPPFPVVVVVVPAWTERHEGRFFPLWLPRVAAWAENQGSCSMTHTHTDSLDANTLPPFHLSRARMDLES